MTFLPALLSLNSRQMIRMHSLTIVCIIILALIVVSATEESSEIASVTKVIDPWPPATAANPSIQDLFREYNQIFRYGNRNAASHRWSTFLLDRARQMTIDRLEFFFSGFCAVSGSPVRPSDYNRYRLTLPQVGTGKHVTGFMHYCCWPCVCDTQDFIRIDTLNVTTSDGISVQRHFTVIGNPCDHPEELDVPFVQPFYGRATTTLSETAREVRCLEGGVMEGATLSDNGYIVIGMFFQARETGEEMFNLLEAPQPGRVTTETREDGSSIMYQDEREWAAHCRDRADNGYNSGMGEIFRKVCAISPISEESLAANSVQADIIETQSKKSSDVGKEEPTCDVLDDMEAIG